MDVYFVILTFCLFGTVYSSSGVKRFLGRVHGEVRIRCDQNSSVVTNDPFICNGASTCTNTFDNIYYGCLKNEFHKPKCQELDQKTFISENGCYYGNEEDQIQLIFPNNVHETFHIFVLHQSIEYANEGEISSQAEAFVYHKCCHGCDHTCDMVKVSGKSWILIKVSNKTDEDFAEFFMDLPRTQITEEIEIPRVEQYLNLAKAPTTVTCEQNSIVVTNSSNVCNEKETCEFTKDVHFVCLRKRFQGSNCDELTRNTTIDQDGCYVSNGQFRFELLFPKYSTKYFHVFVLRTSIEFPNPEEIKEYRPAFHYYRCNRNGKYNCDNVKVDGKSWILTIVSDNEKENFREFFTDVLRNSTLDTKKPTSPKVEKYINTAKAPSKITCEQNSIVVTNDSNVCNEKETCEFTKDVHFVCLRRRFRKSNCDELTRDTTINQDGCYASNRQYRFELLFPKNSTKYFHVFVLRTSVEFPNPEEIKEYRPAFHYYRCNRNGKYNCDNVKVDGKSWILTIVSDNEKEDFGDFFTEPTSKSFTDTQKIPGALRYLNVADAPTKITCEQNSIVVTNDSNVCNEKQTCEFTKDVPFVCLKRRFRKSNCDELTRNTTINQNGCYVSNGQYKIELLYPRDSNKYFHVFVLRTSIEFQNPEQIKEYRTAFFYYRCNRNWEFDCDNVKVDGKSWILTMVTDNREEDFGEFFTDYTPSPTQQKTPSIGVMRYLKKADAPTTIICDENSIVVADNSQECHEKRSCEFSKDTDFVCLKRKYQRSNCKKLTQDTIIDPNYCYVSNEDAKFELQFPRDSTKYFHVFVLRTSIEYPNAKKMMEYHSAFFYFVCSHNCNNVKVDGESWILTLASDKDDEDFGEFFTDIPRGQTQKKKPTTGVLRYLEVADAPTKIICDQNSIVVANDSNVCNEKRSCAYLKDIPFVCLKRKYQRSNCKKLTRDTIIDPNNCYVSNEDSTFELQYPRDSTKYFHVFVLRTSIEFPNLENNMEYRSAFFYYVCCRTCNYDCNNVKVDGKSWILTLASENHDEDFGEFFTDLPKGTTQDKSKSEVSDFLKIAEGPTTVSCDQNSYVVTNDPDKCNGLESCHFSERTPYLCLKRAFKKSQCIELEKDTVIDQDGCYVGKEDGELELTFPRFTSKHFNVFIIHNSLEYPNPEHILIRREAFFHYTCCRDCNHDCDGVKIDQNAWILVKVSDEFNADFGEFFVDVDPDQTTAEPEKKQQYKVAKFFKIADGMNLVICPNDSSILTDEPHSCAGLDFCLRSFNKIVFSCLKDEFQEQNCQDLTRDTPISQSGCFVGKEDDKFIIPFSESPPRIYHIFVLKRSVEYKNTDEQIIRGVAFHYMRCLVQCEATIDGDAWIIVKASLEEEEDFRDFFVVPYKRPLDG